jgi:hypothetical protein
LEQRKETKETRKKKDKKKIGEQQQQHSGDRGSAPLSLRTARSGKRTERRIKRGGGRDA